MLLCTNNQQASTPAVSLDIVVRRFNAYVIHAGRVKDSRTGPRHDRFPSPLVIPSHSTQDHILLRGD